MKREEQLKLENTNQELFRTMMEKLLERVNSGYIVGRNPVESSISSLPSSFSWMMNPPLCLEKTEGRGQRLWTPDESGLENDVVGVSEWNRGNEDSVRSIEKKERSFSEYIKEFVEKYREKERVSENNQGGGTNRYERVGGLFEWGRKKPTEGIRVEQISEKGTTERQNLSFHVPFLGSSDTHKTFSDGNKGWIGNDITKIEGRNLLIDKERMARAYRGTEVAKNFLEENTKVLHQDMDLQAGYKNIFDKNVFGQKVVGFGAISLSDIKKNDGSSTKKDAGYELWREHNEVFEKCLENERINHFLEGKENDVHSVARNFREGNVMQLKNRMGYQNVSDVGCGNFSGKGGSVADNIIEKQRRTNEHLRMDYFSSRMDENEGVQSYVEKQSGKNNRIWNKNENVVGKSWNEDFFEKNKRGFDRSAATCYESDYRWLRDENLERVLDDRAETVKRTRCIGLNARALGSDVENVRWYPKLVGDVVQDTDKYKSIYGKQSINNEKMNTELKNKFKSSLCLNKKDTLRENRNATVEASSMGNKLGITTMDLEHQWYKKSFIRENDIGNTQRNGKTLWGNGCILDNDAVDKNENDSATKKRRFMDTNVGKKFHDDFIYKKNKVVNGEPFLLWREKEADAEENCDFALRNMSNAVVPAYANGGILSTPHLGLVGEAGPEAIIPLSGNRRSRGIALWEEAGSRLGVSAYADGGISPEGSGAISTCNRSKQEGDFFQSSCSCEGNSSFLQSSVSSEEQLSGFSVFDKNESASSLSSVGEISVPVTIGSVSLQVQGGGSGDVISELKGNLGVLTDEIAAELATSLQQVFSNMPLCTEI